MYTGCELIIVFTTRLTKVIGRLSSFGKRCFLHQSQEKTRGVGDKHVLKLILDCSPNWN